MTSKQLTRLTLKQGYQVQERADKRYAEEVLGGKPTASKIRKANINQNPITIMEWAAIVFIIGILAYAWMKVQPSAVTYASTFQPDNVLFAQATGVVFGLIATIGFIFFKIMTDDASVKKRQEENPLVLPYQRGNKWHIGNMWRIEVWSPRMFGVLTYGVLIWHVAIAITGIHNYYSIIEWLNALLPVLIEIGLATTVAKILVKVRERNYQIKEALNLQHQSFKDAFESRNNDTRYLTILFQELRERLASMRGNAWLHKADSDLTKRVIETEYARLNAGNEFALNVLAERSEQETTQAIYESVAQSDESEQFRPPNGANRWTTDTLLQHLTARKDVNPNMEYSQRDLDNDYETGYAVRNAFRGTKGKRDGAKHYFTSYN